VRWRVHIRVATIVAALFDIAGWIFVAVATFLSGSDAATKGLDNVAGFAATALLLTTGVPALLLAVLGRAPRLVLILALAFPMAGAFLFAVTVATFA